MRHLLHHLSFLLCLAAASLSSCVYEDEVPCPCSVRFVYDLNMEFADAFPAQVDDVTLLIFDAEGRYLDRRVERGLQGSTDYRIELDLPAGTYQLLAWAGLCNDADCYTLSPLTPVPGVTTIDKVVLSLNGTESGEYAANPADLWHGLLKDFTVSATAPAEGTIHLTKNTNRFRVLLQAQGRPLQAADYRLGITAANHRMAHDNSPADGCTALTYRPYVQTEASLGNEGTADNLTAVSAELATLRLLANAGQRFTVENTARGETLFDIDLAHYLNLMRLDQYADMPLQEFLDRENTWNIILLMGSDGHLLTIQINAWVLVLNNAEL